MERLTIRHSDGRVSQPSTTAMEVLLYRLAEYEDTGLEPEEIVSRNELGRLSCVIDLLNNCSQFEVSIDRLRELVEADKEGRCVVLPVKVGNTVWICGSVRGVYSAKVRTFFIGRPSLRGAPDNSIQMIRTTECDIPIKDFGKTVFLTREAAEAALKEREQNE